MVAAIKAAWKNGQRGVLITQLLQAILFAAIVGGMGFMIKDRVAANDHRLERIENKLDRNTLGCAKVDQMNARLSRLEDISGSCAKAPDLKEIERRLRIIEQMNVTVPFPFRKKYPGEKNVPRLEK